MLENKLQMYDYLQVLLRRRWVIVTFFVIIVVVALFASLRQHLEYEATATLRIEHRNPQIVAVPEVTPMSPVHYGKDYYETQYKLIKSNSLLKRVAVILTSEYSHLHKRTYTVNELQSQLSVLPVRNSELVKINVIDKSPEQAALIANTVADEFIKQNLERNMQATDYAVDWLSRKLEEQKNKLMDSELALQNHRRQYNINILPEVQGDTATGNISAEYARLQALYANYAERYTENHPRMVELKAQIDSLRNRIYGLEDSEATDRAMEYKVLEREAQTQKRMYDILLTRLKEIDLTRNLIVSNVSIVDRAEVPAQPVKPNLHLNVLLSLVIGLVGGVSLGFVVDYMDMTVRSTEDIRRILRSHCLGGIPDVKGKSDLEKDKIVHLHPDAPVSEAYRHIRTELLFLSLKYAETRTILFTSAETRAGKTMTVSNLGFSFAQKGNSVLLVDTDFRRPQLHKIFNAPKEQGLSDFLRERIPFQRIIKPTVLQRLKVVTVGGLAVNPAELFSSHQMATFLMTAEREFDFIFFDSPPIMSATDAVVLANLVDGVVQVIRCGQAKVTVALRAKEKLLNSKARLLGMLLNDIKAYQKDYKYYKYYSYYRQQQKDIGREAAKGKIGSEELAKEIVTFIK